jgi:hypothetical protein
LVAVSTMGELSDIGISDLIDLFSRRQQTGRLTIKADGRSVDLYLADGRLVLVTSSDLTLRLGRMLIRRGVINAQQLLDVLHQQAETGRPRPLGSILLSRGLVTEQDLARCIEEQSVEVMARVIAARHGIFHYLDGVAAPPHIELVPLQADRILQEATRRIEELHALRAELPAPTAPLFLAPGSTGSLDGLPEPQAGVAKMLRGGVGSLAELAESLPLDELTLGRAVLDLRDRGLLKAGPDRTERRSA